MFRLTCIELNNGAVYIKNHSGRGEDVKSGRSFPSPGVELQTLLKRCRKDDWCWNDIAGACRRVSACRDDVTVAGLMFARHEALPTGCTVAGSPFWLRRVFVAAATVPDAEDKMFRLTCIELNGEFAV
jgi:hypothetical protein